MSSQERSRVIEISTGDTLEITNEDLSQLHHLLDKKKKMMTSSGEIPDSGLKDTQDDMVIGENAGDLTGKPFADPNTILGRCEIGGIDTVTMLSKKVLINNTAAAAEATAAAADVDKATTVAAVAKIAAAAEAAEAEEAVAAAAAKA